MGLPVVGTFHTWFRRSPGYWAFRRLLQPRLDRLAARIAVSRPVVQAMSKYFRAEFEIIPNGVNVEYFHPNGRRPSDALTSGPRLLFLGRLDPRNGLDTVLAAMPEILAAYPATQLTVVGDGPLRGYYQRKARSLGTACASPARCSPSGRTTTGPRTCTCARPRRRRSVSRCSKRWRVERQ